MVRGKKEKTNSGGRQTSEKGRPHIPELLAPAGTKEAFIAAVEAGADAIYCGGELFNARMNAGNFSLEELSQAVDFAHKRNVKVHVTVNTLLKDEELGEALEYIGELWRMGVDALIIQDLGLSKLVRENYPDFEIHLSTQGTVYDFDGVNAAAKLGFKRVVLARELSLEEIREIESPVEIEIFCHGALCYCYSGQCQMSRSIGGRSGNRGGCAQPCRMKYRSFDENGKLLDEPYPLSPSDLQLIDFIPEIAEAGVASIKIEGRMKSPEYVGVVTSIYRKYLDMYRERGEIEVSSDDRIALAQIFNRGFTTGNFGGTQDEGLMSGASPKNRGVLIGRVKSAKEVRSRAASGRFLLEIQGVVPSNGDLLETEDGISFPVTYVEQRSATVVVGDAKEEPRVGALIYRLQSHAQLEDAAGLYRNKDWTGSRYSRRLGLRADVTFRGEKGVELRLTEPASGAASSAVIGGESVAENPDSIIKRFEVSLAKTGGTPFEIVETHFHGAPSGNVFVSQINALRREALEKMEAALVESALRSRVRSGAALETNSAVRSETSSAVRSEDLTTDTARRGEKIVEVFFYSINDFRRFISEMDGPDGDKLFGDGPDGKTILRVLIPAAEVDADTLEFVRAAGRELHFDIALYISNVWRGKERALIESGLDTIREFCALTGAGIYMGNLSQYEALGDVFDRADWISKNDEKAGGAAKVYADFGFNIYNEESASLVRGVGFDGYIESLEAEDVHFGAYPLMTIGHETEVFALEDRKHVRYRLLRPDYSDQVLLVREPESGGDGAALLRVKERVENDSKKRRYYWLH